MEKSKKLKIFLIAVVCLVLMFLGILLCYNSETVNFTKQSAETTMVKADSKIGTIKIQYVDTTGKSIAKEENVSGKVGEWYETERKEIPLYRAFGDEPLNKKGYYSENEAVVKYVYETISTPATTAIDENNQITISVENQKSRSEYDFWIKAVCSQTNENVDEANLEISNNSTLIKSGLTNKGELYVGTITAKDQTTSIYSIKANEANGYASLLNTQFDLSVIKKWNETTKKYEVSLDYDQSVDGIVNVELNTKNQIIITIDYEELEGKYSLNLITKDSETSETVYGSKFKIRCLSKSYFKDVVVENDVENIGDFELSKDTDVIEYYEIEQVEAPVGYENFLKKPTIIEVRKVYNSEKKKYEVDVIYDESLVYIEVNADEEGNITIIVSCAKNKVEDENKAENESEDKNTDKDLGIEFFLNKINEETIKDREPIFTYNQEKKINEVKRKTDKVSIENNDIVNFTARVYNNTDFEVKGGVVIVAIPNGLTFDPNNTINQENEWKMYIKNEKGTLEATNDVSKANIVLSKKLVNQKVTAFNEKARNNISYLDLQVVFNITELTLKDTRNIEISAELIASENDLHDENNKKSEYLYVKYFDLGITKYIEKIEIISEDKIATKELGFDKKDKLTKIEIQAKKLNVTKLNVVYGIKVENKGEIPGLAQEITDFLPEGFTFNGENNPDWYLEDKNIKTTILNTEILNPGESKTIYVSLEWNLDEEHLGTRTNNAKVTKYYNDCESKDITDENLSSSTFIVTVATGLIVYTSIIIAIIAVILLGISILKKYGRKE